MNYIQTDDIYFPSHVKAKLINYRISVNGLILILVHYGCNNTWDCCMYDTAKKRPIEQNVTKDKELAYEIFSAVIADENNNELNNKISLWLDDEVGNTQILIQRAKEK